MGMDVYGKNPANEAGEYFRNNVWWWSPLAEYILRNAPSFVHKCEYWHSNDGDGLDAQDSLALAEWLREQISTGQCAKYAKYRQAKLDALPMLVCQWCDGSGVRKDKIGFDMGHPHRVIQEDGHPRDGQTGWCNGCNGVGKVPDIDSQYPFSVENVAEFATFLESCGGFEIC